jgi:hypothetical protein
MTKISQKSRNLRRSATDSRFRRKLGAPLDIQNIPAPTDLAPAKSAF